ncbi:MAG: hypothetical protein PWP11_1483 [Thauera sp.]|nr:hypothetical protein [Thauera sp.]
MNERVASIGTSRKAVSQQTASNVRPVCLTRKAACAGYPLGIASITNRAGLLGVVPGIHVPPRGRDHSMRQVAMVM